MDRFRRSGADLDPEGKARLLEINVELAKVTTKFSSHILDATNVFELAIGNEAELAGLPATAVKAVRESAQGKGVLGWRCTLQAPSNMAVLTKPDVALRGMQGHSDLIAKPLTGNPKWTRPNV